jgi:hypothetical protein
MKCFETGYKVNYVDENNRFVGYDLEPLCCEDAYHGCVPKDCLDRLSAADSSESVLELIALHNVSDLSGFSFVDEPFIELSNKADIYSDFFAFRVIDAGGNELFVVIGNCQNGSYSHGFESFCGEGEL